MSEVGYCAINRIFNHVKGGTSMVEVDAKKIAPVERQIVGKSVTERFNFIGTGKVSKATVKLLNDESSVEEQSK